MERIKEVARIAGRASVNFFEDGALDRAAVIAYFALLSFLPLAVLLVAVGARALGSFEAAERGTELLLGNALLRLPPGVMTQVRELQEGIWSGVVYLPIALWSASKVFAKIEGGLDAVLQVEQRRPWALRKIFSFAFVGLLSVLLVALVVVSGVLGAVDRFIDSTALAPLRNTAFYQTLNGYFSRYVLPWAFAVLAFFFVYKVVPARFVPARAALVAAVATGSLWEALKVGFTYYVSNVANYTRTYGALEAVVVFLIWVNLSASLLLWGAEVLALVAGARGEPEAQRPSG